MRRLALGPPSLIIIVIIILPLPNVGLIPTIPRAKCIDQISSIVESVQMQTKS